ncbi:hypothetical protein AJ87_07845 [Rhizobium yanglingense]|nr:hypothetical protein AJ87_07845 [Rhizobium yanglingense]
MRNMHLPRNDYTVFQLGKNVLPVERAGFEVAIPQAKAASSDARCLFLSSKSRMRFRAMGTTSVSCMEASR